MQKVIPLFLYQLQNRETMKQKRAYGRGKVRFPLRLSPDLASIIEAEAIRRECSKTDIVEMSLFEYFKNLEWPETEANNNSKTK